ncbi:Hypp2585 [Branchiostoma lanceolatum]|uniref:Hypp2585 protein n=1 Tax=Branchiostoma lanceolatum TaxID=7740 RepID=A0A8J9ZVF4_BRALA|nr:Hypp2585 [Branchiostoma lanceolatum]
MEGAEEENFADPNVVDPEWLSFLLSSLLTVVAQDLLSLSFIGHVLQEMEVFTELVLLSSDKRFGFSVMGGADEGFSPRVDEIAAAVTDALENVPLEEVGMQFLVTPGSLLDRA